MRYMENNMPRDVLLLDIDSILPNLVLMKLSRFHKNLGDRVTLQRGLVVSTRIDHPDIVYISCIFTKNGDAARRLAKQFPGIEVHIGGTGIDLVTELPYEVEHTMPDYDIYPDCNASYGFCSRGCIRKCPYCVVPIKEKDIRAVADIYEFYDPSFKHIVILDNNLMALPDHFVKVASQIKKENLTVNFHGLDIRLINDENAEILAGLKLYPSSNPHFAWDNVKDEKKIIKGIEILKEHGVKTSMFYVLVGYDSTFQEDLYRLETLKKLDQRAYVMRYETVRGNREYNILAAYANQPSFFMKMTFEEFKVERLKLYKKNYAKEEADVFKFK